MTTRHFVLGPEQRRERVDKVLARLMSEVSRGTVQRWIDEERVKVDGKPCRAKDSVSAGSAIDVEPGPALTSDAEPDQSVVLDVPYEDEHLLVVNKPAGLVVHPARGHEHGTLVNGLLARGYFRRDAGEGLDDADANVRPGIVHRLDKGTSGVMVVARTAGAREALKAQFQAHSIERAYEAIVVGRAGSQTFSTLHGRHPRDRMRFTTRVADGKRAVTHVRVLTALNGATHLACTLETGRTHQIRVHLAESGTPVLGDPLYGKPPKDPEMRAVAERIGHQALHARLLGLVHPVTGAHVRFEAPPPADFAEALAALR